MTYWFSLRRPSISRALTLVLPRHGYHAKVNRDRWSSLVEIHNTRTHIRWFGKDWIANFPISAILEASPSTGDCKGQSQLEFQDTLSCDFIMAGLKMKCYNRHRHFSRLLRETLNKIIFGPEELEKQPLLLRR